MVKKIYKNRYMENILPKTGFDLYTDNNTSCNNDEIINIQALLTVFLENAVKSAEIYTLHAKRTIITTCDISLGLKTEVFLFLSRTDNELRANIIANEFKEELQNDALINEMENIDMYDEDDMYDDNNITDSEDMDYEDIEDNPILPNITNDTEPYCYSTCNCSVCANINHYSIQWNTWTPSNEIELLLYNAIKKIEQN